jgi:hypothetical protein
MEAVTLRANLARRLSFARDHGVVLFAFSATLFVSALLLFSVQPIFAKMVLPKLGGSPSVWAVSMCFFQAVLLAGYGYAHILNRFVANAYAPLVHLAVLGTALLLLPFGVPAAAAEPPPGDAYVWLIGVLAAGVGLPFFAISAQAPLLQAWFSQSGHPHASDPYFLYGASNLGSLVALLSYPVVLEPVVGLATQARLWTGAFVILGLMIAACGLLAIVASREGGGSRTAVASDEAAGSVRWSERARWVALAFVPSGLLVAFTSYVTIDIASAPFLWVIPLAMFLATFVLVFRDRPVIPHRTLLLVQPILIAIVLLGISTSGSKGWIIGITSGMVAFFVTTMVCHRELYEQRPAGRHLTEFYMWMSLGGVLGGVFAAIVAPQLFNAIYEFPLLLVLGMACRPGIAAALRDRKELLGAGTVFAVSFGAVAVLAAGIATAVAPKALAGVGVTVLVLGCGVLMLMTSDRPLRQVAYATVMGLGLAILPSALNKGFSERSFFGVHRVVETADGRMRLLMHGTTMHGAQRIREADGTVVAEPKPTTYYYAGSPMVRGVSAARSASGKADGDLNVGVVGLGTGSLACYGRSSETWRFYEIDPVVLKIASNPTHFSFLSRCRPNADVVLGDARLTLAKEKSGTFDYLVIDAFSSDAVPIHLLTVEAVKLYLDRLAPKGLLAIHVSNRHMNLVAVAAAVGHAIPGMQVALADDRAAQMGQDGTSSQVVYMSKSPDTMVPIYAWPDVAPLGPGDVTAWTDDYSNVLTAIWRKYVR